ncbi:TetR family transcriptional regulator [Polaribacter batillariae]|uniref:Biofilm operon icaADBC HTH-type negative transcriptional regulator IcaR n=1 Tax=Polaribacter batillariae TaxID=2808900 RepID=A0ABX7SVE6_9FLAO|nr:TetR family transcriptional regulator [Polaribacter batillariae]QTD37293.1 TetR family transcriptional regulator [Polaribacter batillariae]
MGRKSLKNVRQKEIIESFYTVAQREGLENASLAKVAKEMGVNTSLVLHYFNSKDDLIFELINYILKRYRQIYLSASSTNNKGEPQILRLVDNLFSREWNALIDDSVFYSSFALIFRNKKIKTAYRKLHDNLRLLLSEVIEDAKKNGEIDVDDPKKTADLIFIIVEGAYYYLSLYDLDEDYIEKLNEYKHTALNLLQFTKKKQLSF